jgi:hypothetical protein
MALSNRATALRRGGQENPQVTQLFSQAQLKVKTRPVRRDGARRRIPTGAPRLVESSAERADRLIAEAWNQQLEAIDRSAQARIELLKHRGDQDLLGCPWARLMPCSVACRCHGFGKVTIAFLRNHYANLAVEIAQLVKAPTLTKRFSA